MPLDIGQTFQPGANGDNGDRDRTATPLQRAVQILSLRLPQIIGGRAIAPPGLLTAAGTPGMPAMPAILEALLRQYGQLPTVNAPGRAPSSVAAPRGVAGGSGAPQAAPTISGARTAPSAPSMASQPVMPKSFSPIPPPSFRFAVPPAAGDTGPLLDDISKLFRINPSFMP